MPFDILDPINAHYNASEGKISDDINTASAADLQATKYLKTTAGRIVFYKPPGSTIEEKADKVEAVETVAAAVANEAALPSVTTDNAGDIIPVGTTDPKQIYRVNEAGTWEIDPEFGGTFADATKNATQPTQAQVDAKRKFLNSDDNTIHYGVNTTATDGTQWQQFGGATVTPAITVSLSSTADAFVIPDTVESGGTAIVYPRNGKTITNLTVLTGTASAPTQVENGAWAVENVTASVVLTIVSSDTVTAPTFDAGTAWEAGFDYSGADNKPFNYTPLVPVMIDGKTITAPDIAAGKVFFFKHKVDQTADATDASNDYANWTYIGDSDDTSSDRNINIAANTAFTVATDFSEQNVLYLVKASSGADLTADATITVDGATVTPYTMVAGDEALAVYDGTTLAFFPFSKSPVVTKTRFHVTLAAVTALAGPPAVDVNNPTDAEVKRVTDAAGDVHNAFWTGTDTPTDPIKNAWFVDDNGDLTKAASALEYLNAAEILAATNTEKVINSVELKAELDRREIALDWNKYISAQTVAGWSDAALPIAEANHFYRFSDSGTVATFLGGTNVEVVRGDIVRATTDGTIAATVGEWELIPMSPAAKFPIVYPVIDNAGAVQSMMDNHVWLDEVGGLTLPTAVLGHEYALTIGQANAGDAEAVKAAAKGKTSHFRAVETDTGVVKWQETEAAVGGKATVFADETTLAPAAAGAPVLTEFKTWIDADQENRWNTLIKYNKTDVEDDFPTAVLHADVNGKLTQIEGVKLDQSAPVVFGKADYLATDFVLVTIPNTTGPWIDSNGTTFDQDTVQLASLPGGGTIAAVDPITVAEFLALDVKPGSFTDDNLLRVGSALMASQPLKKGVFPAVPKTKLTVRFWATGTIPLEDWLDTEVMILDANNIGTAAGVGAVPYLTHPVNAGETWEFSASTNHNKLHMKNVTPTSGTTPNFRQSEPFLNSPAFIETGASLLADTTTEIGAENRVNAMRVARPDSGYFCYVPLNTKVREHVIELWVKNPVGSPDGFSIAYLDNDASIDLDGWKWDWTADTFTKSAIGAFSSRPDAFTLEAKGDQGESGYYLRVRLQDPDAIDRATCRFRILTDFVEEGHPDVATSFDISYKITEVVDQNFLEARDLLAIGSTESGSPTNTSNEVITFENGMTWGQINTEYDKVRLVATYGTNYLSGPATRNSEHDMTSWLRSLDGGMYLPLYDVFHSTTNRSVRIYVANNAATSLTLQKNNERCSNFIMYGVKKLIVDPAEVVVAAPDRVLTLTGGQATFNGGDVTYTVKQGHDIRVMADLTANQQIDTATPPTIDDGTVTVVNPVTGELLVNAGPTASVITITEKASLIVQSLAVIGKYAFIPDDPTSSNLLGVNINTAADHNTGIDFTRCDTIRICITESADGGSRHVTEVPVIWNNANGSMKFKHSINTTVRYVSAWIKDFADASAGIIRLDANTTCYIHWIEGLSSDPTGYVVPQAYTIATDRNVSVTGGTNLINGAASVIVKEGIVQPLFLGLNANKQIDTVSTSGAADVEILDPIAGKVRITAAGTDEVITLVEKDALIGKATVSIGRYDFVPDDPTAPTTTGVNIDSAAYHVTGIDFTRCTTAKLCITQASSGAARCVGEAPVFWNGQASAMEFPYANGGTFRYVYATIDNAADAKIGRIHLNSSTTGYAFWIEGFSTDDLKYTVPTGYDATATVNVTANAGANTIDSVNPLPMVTRVGREVSLELPAGQSLDWANPPTIDSGDIKVIDHRRGLVWVVPTAAADITYTTVTAPTTGTHLEYFSAVSTGINSVFPDTGGTGGSADWAAGALTANHNTYNPDNLIDPVNGHELNLPAGVYEAITNVRANNTQLTETGIFLDGVELSHLDAPRSSAGTVTVSSTTQPLIFVVPAGGGKMEVKKQAASGTLMNFAFTLKRLPTEVNVVLAATVLASPVVLTTNAGANTFTGAPRVGTTARCVLGMAGGQMLDYFNQPTCDIPGSAVTVINPIGGEVDIFIPVGAPLTGDITCPTIPVVVPNVQYLRAYSTHAGTSNFGNGHHCQYNNIIKQIGANISLDITSPYSSSGDTPSVGRFEIAPNTGVYKIRGSIAYDASNDYLVFGVRENSNANTRIGLPTSQAKVPAIGTGSQGVYVEAIVEPIVLTRYDIEIRANNGTRWAANGTYGFGELEVQKISD